MKAFRLYSEENIQVTIYLLHYTDIAGIFRDRKIPPARRKAKGIPVVFESAQVLLGACL